MLAHASGKGSKYVKGRGFKRLLKFKKVRDKSTAYRVELEIKKLPRSKKLSWFDNI
ncbi:hypothetical protein B6U91_01970 [Candidatus Pacearchaeota archaeon ex4484_71]|nr:MAG: hypothetical protein B6U91_01970 [Candidatus Pacearchaeota archaeon ex4484_71]